MYAHLVSVLLIALAIFFIEMQERGGVDTRQFILGCMAIFFWPLTILVFLPTQWAINIHKDRLVSMENVARRIKDVLTVKSGHQLDVSVLINVDEKDLKVALYMHRAEKIRFTDAQLLLIRNELMNRTAERDLLRDM